MFYLAHGNAQILCHCVQASIPRPKSGVPRQQGAGQQMHVDPSDAAAIQRTTLDEAQHFCVRHDRRLRQGRKLGKQCCVVGKVPTGQFADHERVYQHDVGRECRRKLPV